MPFDSNGNASLVPGYLAVDGQTILSSQHNPPLEDIASMLSQVILRSGVAPMSGQLNMNGFRVVNIGNPTADGDAVNKSTFDAAVSELGGELSSRSSSYTAVDADFNTTFRFTGSSATLSIDAGADLRSTWYIEAWADGGSVIIDPNGTETINGLTTITLSKGQKAQIYRTSATTFVAYITGGIWAYKGIGEVYMVDTSLTGVDIPPVSATDVVYIELTAGLTGVGQFNNGKLTTESVIGTAPLVLASAVISVAGSPMNGQTVRLLNSEGRILRPGTTAGTLQNDAMQNVTSANAASTLVSGTPDDPFRSGSAQDSWSRGGGSGTATSYVVDFDLSRSARTSTETRMKNVAVKAYMRVK